jgi:hypothetical protein
MKAGKNDDGNAIIKRFPLPAPIDEVYLQRKDLTKPEEKPEAKKEEAKTSFTDVLVTVGIVLGAILLLLLFLPSLIFRYYVLRYNNASVPGKPYWAYRAATFYLHQVGVFRNELTPMQYASKVVDPGYGTSFATFMNSYLKQKYAKQPLTPAEEQSVAAFLKPFISRLRKQIGWKQRIGGFINPVRTVSFYVRPEEE